VSSPEGTQQVNRSNLAAFDVRTGALIPSFVADTDGRVDDLLFDGTSLFVSGSFRTLIAQAITIPPPTTTTTTTTTPTTTAPPTTSSPTTSPPTTSPPPATISPSPPPPATRASTPVENDVLDLRSALPWSIRRPGETTASGWTTASFDDRGWAYDTAPLGDVGAFQAARTQFTADPNRPLSLMVRAVPGATITAGTVGDARSPTTSRRARSRGISTLRVAPHSDTGA